MNILILNPNTSDEITQSLLETGRRCARPDTNLTATRPDFGPRSIEGPFEKYVATHAMLEKVLFVKDQYDAFIVACYGDPGLDGVRTLVDAPVVGIGQASLFFAAMLGRKFSVLIPLPEGKRSVEELVQANGLSNRLASIRSIDLPVLDAGSTSDLAMQRLIETGRRAMSEDGAEVLCLGCAGMALMDVPVSAALGIPVLDGTVCAVKLAEGLVDCGLKTSKVGPFRAPRSKDYVGCPHLSEFFRTRA